MITIVYKENGFIVTGHASYAEHGRDIVCSAVSALSQTTLLGLIEYADVSYMQADGYLDVTVNFPNTTANILIDVMYKGLREIMRAYPLYIEFKEEEEWEKQEDLKL